MKVKEYRTKLLNGVAVLKECNVYTADGRAVFSDPSRIADFLKNVGLADDAEERAFALVLNNKLKLTACFEISHGSADTSIFPIRETLTKALLLNAAAIAIGHNHPSGDVTPSSYDVDATERLKAACDVVGIKLIDHVIIGGNTYCSFCEEGRMS